MKSSVPVWDLAPNLNGEERDIHPVDYFILWVIIRGNTPSISPTHFGINLDLFFFIQRDGQIP